MVDFAQCLKFDRFIVAANNRFILPLFNLRNWKLCTYIQKFGMSMITEGHEKKIMAGDAFHNKFTNISVLALVIK